MWFAVTSGVIGYDVNSLIVGDIVAHPFIGPLIPAGDEGNGSDEGIDDVEKITAASVHIEAMQFKKFGDMQMELFEKTIV